MGASVMLLTSYNTMTIIDIIELVASKSIFFLGKRQSKVCGRKMGSEK